MIELYVFDDSAEMFYEIKLENNMEHIARACADGLRQHGYRVEAYQDVHERKKVHL